MRQVVIYVTDSHWVFTFKVDSKGKLRGEVHFTKAAKRPAETDHTVKDLIKLRDKFPEVYTKAVKLALDNM